MEGWFKLHRKIMENQIFSDADLLRLWIFCLSKATYKETKVMIDKQEVELTPGQFVTGRFALFADYNLGVSPRKKVKDTTLWSWLKRLETYGNIDIKTTNKYSVVTVVKWLEYQDTLTSEPQQTDNKLTAVCCQTDTNKKLRSEEVKKRDIVASNENDDMFNKFWEIYPNKIGKAKAKEHWNKKVATQIENGSLTIEKVLEGTRDYIEACKLKDRTYKDGSAFVNQESWNEPWRNVFKKNVQTSVVIGNQPSKQELDEIADIARRQAARNRQ